MAKKKSVKKKSAKKKAVKKKAVKKKADKKAARKYSKKQSGKKGGSRNAAAAVGQIKYRCVNGVCTATPKFASIGRSTVDLIAVNTDVTITFISGSPFVSGTNPIHIANGTTDQEVVRSNANGPFPYRLACSMCVRTSVTNPEMIVP